MVSFSFQKIFTRKWKSLISDNFTIDLKINTANTCETRSYLFIYNYVILYATISIFVFSLGFNIQSHKIIE